MAGNTLEQQSVDVRWPLLLVLAAAIACRGPADLVASSSGDYDPNHPPESLALTGDIEVHDPTLFYAQGKYFVYYSGSGLLTKSSPDMLQFKNEPAVFDRNPSWIADLLPDTTDLWSPAVAEFGGLIHLYYAASFFGSSRSCIGHATAASLSAGFVDKGWVVCSNVTDVVEDFNAIDPGIFVEDAQAPWLVFGSFQSGIKLIALNAAGQRRDSTMYSLAARSSDNPAIQASFLMKRGGYYYLFVSFDLCCQGAASTHHIMVGRAESVTGPYLDRDGIDMLNGGGTLVLEGDTRWRGPGSSMVYVAGQRRFNVYHTYDAEANGRPTLRIAELFFDNDGWPVSGGP